MKRLLLATFVTVIGMASHAEDSPLWMRYCAISPDGGQIAFTYKGDIYTVPAVGGKALQITSNQGHDTHPWIYLLLARTVECHEDLPLIPEMRCHTLLATTVMCFSRL